MVVLKYFEEISRIPRGSGHEKAISDYLVAFAKKYGVQVIQDEALNVIIKKPATPGFEQAPTLILQGHLDMVCEKNKGTEHNFFTDPLKLKREGDYLLAEGTTLGADNGVAIAMMMAILADPTVCHPALEMILTAEEESGMHGALALNPADVAGRMLINLDSEEEGIFCVSCAGGVRSKITLPLTYRPMPKDGQAYSVQIKGLLGGHSGGEIHLGRANANKLMGRILQGIAKRIALFSLNGGMKDNAIPREAEAGFVSAESPAVLQQYFADWQTTLRKEFALVDAGIEIVFQTSAVPTSIWSVESSAKAIALLLLVPNGVMSMSAAIPGLVQSSANLGVVQMAEGVLALETLCRSSVLTLKEELMVRLNVLAEQVQVENVFSSAYPAWEYREDSYLRQLVSDVYERFTGKKAEISATHAGLECGILQEKFGEIDMISFGPEMYAVHTPDEKLSVSSLERTYQFLLEVLKSIQ